MKHGLFCTSRRCLHCTFSHKQCRKPWHEPTVLRLIFMNKIVNQRPSRSEMNISPLRSQSRQAAGRPTDKTVWVGKMTILYSSRTQGKSPPRPELIENFL